MSIQHEYRYRIVNHILFAMMFLFAIPVFAAEPPRYFTVPASATIGAVVVEDFGEAEIPLPEREEPNILQGRHWSGDMNLEDPALPEEASAGQVFAALQPTLVRNGWTVVHAFDHGATLRYQRDGKDAWCYIGTGDPHDIRWQIIELAQQTASHKLVPPAAKPEVFSDKSPIPYLTPLAGSSAGDGVHLDEPLLHDLDGSDQPSVIANGRQQRFYGAPSGHISPLQMVQVYETALKTAGWQIVAKEPGGIGAQGGMVLAHYTGNGRDIWAKVSGGGDSYLLEAADVGSDDLARQLASECRATLTGVFFDFNKATIKPESDTTLARLNQALKANPAQAWEVQGHTDNIGTDSYNQLLSEQRAASVVTWLTTHGVEASRLDAKGYAKKHPVVDNNTEEGRARNRRVDIVCRK